MTNNIQGNPIRLSADFSTETLQARKLSSRFDGEVKSFPDKQKSRHFTTTKPALQQTLKEPLYTENTREGKDLQKINPKQLRKWS